MPRSHWADNQIVMDWVLRLCFEFGFWPMGLLTQMGSESLTNHYGICDVFWDAAGKGVAPAG